MASEAKLYFFCGKMAAGKSTFASALARRQNAVLLVQDQLLDQLYPGEIADIPDFVKYSSRLKTALAPHISSRLSKGVSVVLDFPGNTRTQRSWFRELFEGAKVGHELHFIDVSNEVCKAQLKERTKGLPSGAAWTTEPEFDAITAHFQLPTSEEEFNVIRHSRA